MSAPKTPALNMQGTLWVIICLFISMLPQLMSMPLHLVPITILPISWRLLAEFKKWQPIKMPYRVVMTLFAVIVLLATYGGLMGRRAAVSMLVLMLSLKLLETYKTRDARIVVSLSLFLCGTQFLFSQGVPMIVYITACLLSSLIALMYLQRIEAWAFAERTPESRRGLFGELGYGLRILAIALPVGLVVFMFFPRWSSPLWGVPENALDARSGLSDSMSPGSIQSLFMDDSPAFRVEFEGEVPVNAQLYWRGPVFSDFDGTRWQSDFMSLNLPAESKADPAGAPFRYRVQLEPTEQRWLLALDYPALIPRASRLFIDQQLVSNRSVTRLREYVMASDPGFIDSPVLKHTLRRRALELPAGFNPRTERLIKDWRASTNSNEDLVRRTLTYFNTEQFHYTLNPPLLSRNTVDEFLFETREGFCEHYASAFTVMMRMAGIPARVVTGYQGGWYNDIGDYFLVRQSDAHAWSEVWLEGKGWSRVDPTAAVAPSRVEQGATASLGGRRHMLDFPWLRKIKNGFDLFQRGWNNWVVTFNAVGQARLFSRFGWGALDSTKLVLMLVTSLLILFMLIFFLTPYLLRIRSHRSTDPDLLVWMRFISKLKRAGFNAKASTGPVELAKSASTEFQHQADDILRISELYVWCRYADSNEHRAELTERIRRFKVRSGSR